MTAKQLQSGYDTIWSVEPILNLATTREEDRVWLSQLEGAFSTCAEDALVSAPDERDFSCPIVDGRNATRLVRHFFPIHNPSAKLGGLQRPLDPTQLLATPHWSKMAEQGKVRVTNDRGTLPTTVVAGMLILNQCYGQELEVHHRRVVEAFNETTGLTTFYVVQPSFDFVRVEVVGEKPQITDTDIRRLLGQPDNPALWLEAPPADGLSV